MIGHVMGRSGVRPELSWPPEWAPARRFTSKPPIGIDIDLGSGAERALRFRVRPTHTVQSVVHSVLGLLFAILTAGSVVLTVRDPTSDAVVGSIVLAIFAGVFLSTGILAVISTRRGLGVDLAVTGVVVRIGGQPTVLTWEDVAKVASASESGHNTIKISVHNGPPVTLPCRKLKTDPLVVFHTLRFYASHPDNRHELGGDQALPRVWSGRLP